MKENNNNPEALGSKIVGRFEQLWSEQHNFRSEWQDCADYIMPRKGQIEEKRSPGERQTAQIFETTAETAADTFGAGIVSSVTPPGQVWARYKAPDDAPADEREWLDKCSRVIMRLMHSSNWYEAWHEDATDAGIFASSLTLVEETKDDAEEPFNFAHVPTGFFVWDEDDEGMVSEIYRCFEWTKAQVCMKWPDACELESLKDAKPDVKFKVIHAIYKRKVADVMPGYTVGSKRPVASVYVLEQGKHELENTGYYEWPAMAGRLKKSNGEVYGRGPGVQALPEIKLINRQEKSKLIVTEKLASPGWLMPEDASYTPDNRADGITYWDVSNPANKPEQVELKNRLDWLINDIADRRERINGKFYVDMWKMLTNMEEMKREKTAFEVAQMLQEKLKLFSPIFGRMVREKLDPMMRRVFGIALRKGLLPEPPLSVIENGISNYKIEYVSKIALAIRAAINENMAVLVELVERVAQFDESAPLVVNWRKAIRDVSGNQGIPAEWLRDDEEVDGIMAELQQRHAAEQAPDAAQKMATAAEKLGPSAQRKVAREVAAA